MKDQQAYLAVLLTALVVLLLGCWKPQALNDRSGQQSYLWVALIALAVGLLTLWLGSQK